MGEVEKKTKVEYNKSMDFDSQIGTTLSQIENEISSLLPAAPGEEWLTLSFGQLDSGIHPEHLEPLITPTRTLVELGGKRWRPLLLVLTAECASQALELSEKEEKAVLKNACHLAPLVEFVHTASLIHDDIEDNSDTRRGKPAAHLTYGMDTALNAGSWLFFQAGSAIKTLDAPIELKEKLHELYMAETRKLHLGQAMDISWHRKVDYMPPVDSYLSMVRSKTGTLSSLAAKTGALLARCNTDIVKKAGVIAADIGAGFQIIDDVINLTTGNVGKKRGDDIVEGKKSLPIILFMQKNKNNDASGKLLGLINKAKAEGIESPAVEEAISLLTESGVIETARQSGISAIENGCSSFASLFASVPSTEKVKWLFERMIPKSGGRQ